MTSKILAGLGMILPAFALNVYKNQTTQIPAKPVKDTVVETAGDWFFVGSAVSIICLAYVGVFHVGSGLYELSPTVCPRE